MVLRLERGKCHQLRHLGSSVSSAQGVVVTKGGLPDTTTLTREGLMMAENGSVNSASVIAAGTLAAEKMIERTPPDVVIGLEDAKRTEDLTRNATCNMQSVGDIDIPDISYILSDNMFFQLKTASPPCQLQSHPSLQQLGESSADFCPKPERFDR